MKPFRFVSYQIYEADSSTLDIKINTFVNTTSSDVMGYFPQYMYESALKTATQNPDLKVNLNTIPYPLLFLYTDRVA